MKQSYPLFDNKCPLCKSETLMFDSLIKQDEIILHSVECNDCGYRFGIYTTCTWYLSETNDE